MSDDPLVLVGEITSAFGIRGEIKMLPLMDDPKHLLKLPAVLFRWQEGTATASTRNGSSDRHLKVVGMRRHQGAVLLTVDGVPDRTAADRFPGARVFVRRSELPALDADSYYEADLIGLRVVTESGADLGSIERVHFIPAANDVYETAVAMIPAIEEVVVGVDLAEKRVLVRDMAGLRKDEP